MALTGNYKDIYFVLDRLHLRYGFDEVSLYDVAEHIWDIMGYIGNPDVFEKKYAEITISNFRGTLPTDFYSLDQGSVSELDTFTPLTSSLDELSLLGDNNTSLDVDTESYTFKIVNGYIFCGIEETTLVVQYKAFPVDSNNLPLIPDHPKAIRLVVDYIAEALAMKFYMRDKLTKQKFDVIQQEALFSRASFRSSALTLDVNTIERMKNRAISLLVHPDMHDNNFMSMGSKVIQGKNAITASVDTLVISTTIAGAFTISLEGFGDVLINWGDGSAVETVALDNLGLIATTHMYTAGGDLSITNVGVLTKIVASGQSITSFVVPDTMSNLEYLDLGTNAGLTVVELPEEFSELSYIDLNSCGITVFTNYDGWGLIAYLSLANNSLNLDAVNNILTTAYISGISSGTISLNGGTNAIPTGAGATAKADLITRGLTVNTN